MGIKTNTSSLQTLLAKASSMPRLSNVTATAAGTLEGEQFIDKTGAIVQGAMPNNEDVSVTIDGLDVTSVEIPLGYTSGGTIALDDTISEIGDEQADLIAQVAAALRGKSAGGESNESVSKENVAMNIKWSMDYPSATTNATLYYLCWKSDTLVYDYVNLTSTSSIATSDISVAKNSVMFIEYDSTLAMPAIAATNYSGVTTFNHRITDSLAGYDNRLWKVNESGSLQIVFIGSAGGGSN